MTVSNTAQHMDDSISSMQGNTSNNRSPVQVAETPTKKNTLILCTKCGADKVAKSRAQSLDALKIRLVPRRPYRCMRCYHRFWHREAFSADKRRVKTWIWIGSILTLLVVYQILLLSFGSSAIESSDSVKVSSYQSGVGSDPPPSTTTAQIDLEKNRAVIESFDFQPPLEANEELAELSIAGLSAEQVQERLNESRLNESASDNQGEAAITEVATGSQPAELDSRGQFSTQTIAPPSQNKADESLDLAPVAAEQLALVKVDINLFIDQWRRSWEEGDLSRYLGFYADNFMPANGDTRAEWERQRITRVSPERAINVSVSNIEISVMLKESRARAVFEQDYRASNYSDRSRKELLLTNKGDRWYIVSEREL